ncbi:MAG: alpha/beta hydrolase [Pseudomonadota bacterium]
MVALGFLAAGLAAAIIALGVITAVGVHLAHGKSPPCGAFIEVGGQRLHYTDRGEGPALVLIHGASSNLLEFEHSIAPRLAEHHRVLCFDRPGCGHSPRQREGEWLDPTALARLVLDACEQLGAEQPVIIGHSWAGSIVMASLVHEARRVRGGVLLAGAAGHWIDEPTLGERLDRWPGLLPLFAYTVVFPVGSLMVPKALASVFSPHPVPEGHADRVGARLAVRPQAFLQDAQDIHELSPYLQLASPQYRAIAHPLLALHGDQDDVVPYWNHGQRFESIIEHMTTEVLPGQGHALHHVIPARIADRIATFVSTLQAPEQRPVERRANN